jgi:hypothetical protein
MMKSEKFVLYFTKDSFLNANVLLTENKECQLRVTKAYKYNLWRKLLHRLGIPFKLFDCKLEEQRPL